MPSCNSAPGFLPAASRSMPRPTMTASTSRRPMSTCMRRSGMVAANAGYIFPGTAWTPRFGVKTDIASGDHDRRSEEHTSELQSLMRISYAVFCLKKKKNNKTRQDNSTYDTNTTADHHNL